MSGDDMGRMVDQVRRATRAAPTAPTGEPEPTWPALCAHCGGRRGHHFGRGEHCTNAGFEAQSGPTYTPGAPDPEEAITKAQRAAYRAFLADAKLGAALRAALASLPPHKYASLAIVRDEDAEDTGSLPWMVIGDEPGRVIYTDATKALAAALAPTTEDAR
jgi:hypothetical protein